MFAADRRATVHNLDAFLEGKVNGAEFIEENYFTHDMLTLVDRAFRSLELRRRSCPTAWIVSSSQRLTSEPEAMYAGVCREWTTDIKKAPARYASACFYWLGD